MLAAGAARQLIIDLGCPDHWECAPRLAAAAHQLPPLPPPPPLLILPPLNTTPWCCRHCPSLSAAVELQDDCGLPLGLVAQPLARPDGAAPTATCWAADLARCSRCLAFINALCDVDDHGWACALCGCTNDFASAANLRR